MRIFRLPRRRHELVLVLLLVAAAGLFGFWLGRATSPDPELSYLRGKSEGAASERSRLDQTQIELKILKGEANATRTASKPRKDRPESDEKRTREEPEEPTETAIGAPN